MSTSLVQIVQELQRRVAALEKISAKRAENTGTSKETPAAPSRGMCPHCGVKPNHFFHVKACGGKLLAKS